MKSYKNSINNFLQVIKSYSENYFSIFLNRALYYKRINKIYLIISVAPCSIAHETRTRFEAHDSNRFRLARLSILYMYSTI